MDSIEEKKKSFLRRLQESDAQTKRRWTIACTAVAVVVVLGVWLTYFNNLIAALDQSTKGEVATTETDPGFSFSQSVQGGVANIWQGTEEAVKGIGKMIGQSKTYEVAPEQ